MLRTHTTGTEALLGLGKSRTLFCPTPRLALALARGRAHFSKDVHKNGLFVGRKLRCVGHLAGEVAYKQEEQQDHSGRTTPTDGGQRSPLWQMEGHLVVWVRCKPRKAGLVKPPTTLPGAAKGHTASRLSRGKDGWACVGSRVAVSQEIGTNSSSSLGLTGLPEKNHPEPQGMGTNRSSLCSAREGPSCTQTAGAPGKPSSSPSPSCTALGGWILPLWFSEGCGKVKGGSFIQAFSSTIKL